MQCTTCSDQDIQNSIKWNIARNITARIILGKQWRIQRFVGIPLPTQQVVLEKL